MSEPLRVALVEAPFGPCAWPSIGTSLLKAGLVEAGHEAEVLYLNLEFLELCGPPNLETVQRYQDVSDAFGVHFGEWIFGPAAFPDADWATLDAEYRARLHGEGHARILAASGDWRAQVATFLSRSLARHDWGAYDVVGFSNAYSQLNASLAIARRVRTEHPGVRLIMGGCGCAGEMGVAVMEICDDLDAVVTGEADDVIAPLCEALARPSGPATLAELPGVLFRADDGHVAAGRGARRIRELGALPVPDYHDYYRFLPPALNGSLPHYVPIEASRGCWWGAKQHCTFCGLSQARMAYFRKEPARFLSEVRELRALHRPTRFMAVDNIMPHEYYAAVVPHLGEASGGAEFFFEVKANFDRPKLELFARNAVHQIQPGIESLSSPVLRLMRKGTTGIANIYTLRLCEELGLRAHWSILHGFEGERLDDYVVTAELIWRIQHLRPPLGLVEVQLERSSPMGCDPERFGFHQVRPSHWYDFCHPVGPDILGRLAYRFDADRSPEQTQLMRKTESLVGPRVAAWRTAYGARSHGLRSVRDRNIIHVERRVASEQRFYSVAGTAADLLDLLDKPTRVDRLGLADGDGRPSPYLDAATRAHLARAGNTHAWKVVLDSRDVSEAYTSLLANGLVVEEDGRAVAVAVSAEPRQPHAAVSALVAQLSGAGGLR